jgi:hypothetical protein
MIDARAAKVAERLGIEDLDHRLIPYPSIATNNEVFKAAESEACLVALLPLP